jgi:DNA end-binding protein Ku
MKSMWSGEIRFGLVAVPVKLYKATEDSEPRAHLIHAVCGSRISMVRRCSTCDRDIEYEECVSAVEVSPGKYVPVPDEGAAGDRVIRVLAFTKYALDPRFVEGSYYMAPDYLGTQRFSLFREVLVKRRICAICMLALRGSREHIAFVGPFGSVMSLTTLRYVEEVRAAIELEVEEVRVDEQELALARRFVQALYVPSFDISSIRDERRAILRAEVERQASVTQIGGPTMENLLDALQRSIQEAEERKRA